MGSITNVEVIVFISTFDFERKNRVIDLILYYS